MALTEAEKLAFGEWMDTTLDANKETILNAKPDIPFGVDGYKTLLAEKHAKVKGAEGELARLEQEKQRQTAIANDSLKDYYKTASELADALVAHLGKDHKLSNLIRDKRGSMKLGPAKSKETETPSGE
ncbi:MAG: hypothetical protein A7315_02290 [Candidatus Altiarchaeales archaeon WOR_SM1_79]|nr:MAG: hypothetical protein A7315_02290 [Candidatus Altiarchaeales archaeon WOR_SM1_79]